MGNAEQGCYLARKCKVLEAIYLPSNYLIIGRIMATSSNRELTLHFSVSEYSLLPFSPLSVPICIILIMQPSSRVNAMTPEEEARQEIDRLLDAAGCQVQD